MAEGTVETGAAGTTPPPVATGVPADTSAGGDAPASVTPPVPAPGVGSPPSGGPPPAVPVASGSGRGRTIAVVAGVGAIALVAVLVVGASGMLSGASASPSAVAIASVSSTPSATPSPSLTPGASPTAAPTATAAPAPTSQPTPTPTPAGRQARITGITISGGQYVVAYQVFGYTPALPGRHVHFFFDTVSEANAGVPGKGPWILYAGPIPFTQYAVSDRPAGATQMCILVANADHSVVKGTGNCVDLPS